jgi:serine/threonine protein kinase
MKIIYCVENLIIGDFGSARKFGCTPLTSQIYSQPVVTFHYRAPELLLGTKVYTSAIDMWSIGCIFAELVTKQVLFKGDSSNDQKKRIFRFMGTPN